MALLILEIVMTLPKNPLRKTRWYGDVPSNIQKYWGAQPRSWWIKKISYGLLIITGVGIVGGTVTMLIISRDLPDPNNISDRQVAESTKIYDRTGEHLLYEIFQNQKRTIVKLDEISIWVPKAFVSVEDKFFYEHNGVRLISILRAGVNNLIGRRTGSGGASTITQQLIKNTIVGSARSGFQGYFRKIKEALLALQLEKKYSKDDILKMYLNEIPLGSTNYGVEAASQSYFHKSSKELSLSEAATLAAMTQAPTRYLNNPDSLRNRRDLVLRLMFDQGYITEIQKSEAQNTALRLYRNSGIFDSPHFVLHVRQLLADQFGEKLIDTGGLKVITTLDYDKQKIAEEVVKEQADKLLKDANANNAALVALDPKTHQILAMVGSIDFRNEEVDGQFNVVTLGKLQPGSSFKPFVYTLAFQKGYTPETVLYDVKTNFDARDGQKYTPRNSYDKENGLVTMRKALQGSLNIPAVKTLYLTGINDTVEFAKRFGYSTFTGEYGLSMVLGAAEVNLLEHTNAYATLADNGHYNPPSSILKVTDNKGDTLYEWQNDEGTEAIAPELAAEITGVLTDDEARAYVFGRRGNLTLPDRPVAAKTGTTQESRDAWTLGYTPNLAAGVWVGNTPMPKPMKAGGNQLAGGIWHNFMARATKSMPIEFFPDPPPKAEGLKPVLSGADAGIKLKINMLTGRIANSSTPDHLIVEKVFLPPHDILQYVRRDDPRGLNPDVPEADPQYLAWEAALQEWVARQREKGVTITLEEPPTEYDTAQSLELIPTLEVVVPAAGQVYYTRTINFEVNATAPRGVGKVHYYIDGIRVATADSFPFSGSYSARNLSIGPHLVKVIAEDDLGNTAAKEIQIMMQADFDPPSFEWLEASPLAISGEEFPRTFFIDPFRWEEMKDIKIFWNNGGEERLIYTFNRVEDKLLANRLNFTWKNNPGHGTHLLRGVMTDKQGRFVERQLQVFIQ